MDKPVLARVIVEMLGAPQDYLTQTMRAYVDKLTGTHTVLKSQVAEAQPQDQMFSIYAELEMRFKDLADLLDFCFESMPSSVEVVEPAEFCITLDRLNAFLNDLQGRLHEADAIIKTERARKQVLDTNATNVFRRFLLAMVEHGHATAGEISHYVGVHPAQLTPFLDKLVEEKKLKKNGDQYAPVS